MAKRSSKKTSKASRRGGASSSRRGGAAAAKKKPVRRNAARQRGGGSEGEGRASPKPNASEMEAALGKLRKKIDTIDRKLVKLLNDRAGVAIEVGKIKRAQPDGMRRIYASDREALMLDRILSSNAGPLPDRAIEAVYREIISGSIALEQPVRIGFLGPAGSHSHDAAARHFGSSVDLVFEDVHTIAGVFQEVARGNIDYGLVPIENSTMGGVVDTLDAFLDHAGQLTIYAEVQISIHHALLAECDPKEIRRIYSKPEVFLQCKHWVGEQMGGREQIETSSSSRAVEIAQEENRKAVSIGHAPTSAAIGNRLAGELYGMDIVFEAIEDNPNNITRFFVIGREKAGPTGDDKTSVMFTTEHKPGALVEVLGVFHTAGINLSHIDKRPSGRENWQYTFFCDAMGHRDETMMQAALARVQAHCKEMVVLGSYPRSKRIL